MFPKPGSKKKKWDASYRTDQEKDSKLKRIKNSEREADLKTKLIAKINSFSLNLEESEEVIQYKLIQLVKGEVNQIFEEKKGHEPENEINELLPYLISPNICTNLQKEKERQEKIPLTPSHHDSVFSFSQDVPNIEENSKDQHSKLEYKSKSQEYYYNYDNDESLLADSNDFEFPKLKPLNKASNIKKIKSPVFGTFSQQEEEKLSIFGNEPNFQYISSQGNANNNLDCYVFEKQANRIIQENPHYTIWEKASLFSKNVTKPQENDPQLKRKIAKEKPLDLRGTLEYYDLKEIYYNNKINDNKTKELVVNNNIDHKNQIPYSNYNCDKKPIIQESQPNPQQGKNYNDVLITNNKQEKQYDKTNETQSQPTPYQGKIDNDVFNINNKLEKQQSQVPITNSKPNSSIFFPKKELLSNIFNRASTKEITRVITPTIEPTTNQIPKAFNNERSYKSKPSKQLKSTSSFNEKDNKKSQLNQIKCQEEFKDLTLENHRKEKIGQQRLVSGAMRKKSAAFRETLMNLTPHK